MIERFKKARLKAKLTQDMLAGVLGVTQATVSNIENGRQTPTIPLAMKIERTLGIPLAYWAKNKRGRAA